jgi:hypothetical protein
MHISFERRSIFLLHSLVQIYQSALHANLYEKVQPQIIMFVLSMKIFTIPPQSNLSIEGVSHYLDGSECLCDLDA